MAIVENRAGVFKWARLESRNRGSPKLKISFAMYSKVTSWQLELSEFASTHPPAQKRVLHLMFV